MWPSSGSLIAISEGPLPVRFDSIFSLPVSLSYMWVVTRTVSSFNPLTEVFILKNFGIVLFGPSGPEIHDVVDRVKQRKIVKSYLKYVDLFNEWVAKGFAWFVLILVIGMTYSTMMRYVFGKAPVWNYDFTYIVYAVFFMMGAAYTLRLKEHVRVDVFYRLLSLKWQAIVDMFFTLVAFFPLFVAIFYFSMDRVIFSWQIGEKSLESVLRIPIYPFKTVIPVVSLMLLLQGLAEFIRNLSVVITGKELQWK